MAIRDWQPGDGADFPRLIQIHPPAHAFNYTQSEQIFLQPECIIEELTNVPKIIDCTNFVDDRGVLTFSNEFNFVELGIKRFYQVENHKQGTVRAWHGHKNEEKYVYVVKGSALLAAVYMETEELYKFTLSDRNPKILRIPKGYANGFKTLSSDCVLMFFSTSTTEESKGDDIRYDWDKWNCWEEDFR